MATTKVTSYGVDEYTLKINTGGEIILDPGIGRVTIRGDLDVVGETTAIGSTELVIADKTITINDSSDSTLINGVPDIGDGLGRTAGLIVNRGILPNVHILFDENRSFLDPTTGTTVNGAFKLENAPGKLIGLYTNSIKPIYDPGANSTENSLYLISEGNGVISVTGTVDYEKQVFPYTGSAITTNIFSANGLSDPIDDDIIPNIRAIVDYIRDYHLYNFQTRINSPLPNGDTRVETFDTEAGAAVSKVEIGVNGSLIAEFFSNRINLSGIKIQSNTITPLSINDNLVLEATGTGTIYTEFPLEFAKRSDPDAPADGVKLYSKTEADGGTGLFFINENSTTDEIISRNKALLYSIIF